MQRLLPISPGTHSTEGALIEAVADLVASGVHQLLLREPLLQHGAIRKFLHSHSGLKVILHERCVDAEELASEYACGLHLSSVTPVCDIRRRFEGLVGVSTHSAEELVKAEAEGADYALLSPLYRPHSKPEDLRPPLGLDRAREAIGRVSIPVFVLGGIDVPRAGSCRETGAYGVAAIGALFGAGVDTPLAARAMLSALV